MVITLLIIFVTLMLLGMPIVFAIGISGAVTFLVATDIPALVVVQKLLGGLDSYALLAAPFFIIAGVIMEGGGISKRLINFSNALVGSIRGGLLHVSVVASMIFAGISGSGVADATAVGTIMIPQLKKAGYGKGFSAALIASSGSIGQIIPPSMLMIVYGSITGISVGELFLGGIIPGLLMGFTMMVFSYFYARKKKISAVTGSFQLKRLWISFKEAFWALLTPILIVGGIVSGVFTATEAGAVAVIYAFVISVFVYKEMKIKDIIRIFSKGAVTNGSVMIMISYAAIFGYIFAVANVPQMLKSALTSMQVSPYLILFFILGSLVLLGCLVETMASMLVLVPILMPIGVALGFDPIHFGIMVIIALNLGGITPPVGMLLFLTTSLAETKLTVSSREIFRFILMIVMVLIIIAFVPPFVIGIPGMLMGK